MSGLLMAWRGARSCSAFVMHLNHDQGIDSEYIQMKFFADEVHK